MESAEFVLESRFSTGKFYVRLTTNRTGRKQWEFVEQFDLATAFQTANEIERRTELHHCPRNVYRVRDYNTAHSDYLQHATTRPTTTTPDFSTKPRRRSATRKGRCGVDSLKGLACPRKRTRVTATKLDSRKDV